MKCFVMMYKRVQKWLRCCNQKKETAGYYDIEETYPDCTVQILTNSETGAQSIGWWRNKGGDTK